MPSPEALVLQSGWEAAATEPDACLTQDGLDKLSWIPAQVPGTAASALRDAGTWSPGDEHDFDAQDWWFRVRFPAPAADDDERVVLHLGGIATVADAHFNGELLLRSVSMFAGHAIDVSDRLRADNYLAVRCHALGPLLGVSRKPRARWRQKVTDGNLRWFRTMLLGRAPGFAPGPAAVGLWRPVWLERRRGAAVEALDLRPSLHGDDGVLVIRARVTGLEDARELAVSLSGPSGSHDVILDRTGAEASGELVIPAAARWWPHTHGDPVLHDVRLLGADGEILAERRIGFRQLAPGPAPSHDVERDGLALHVNGVPAFARGAVWTPIDPIGLAPSDEDLRAALEQVRDGGLNLVRVVGTGAYESAAFHDLCDELGILVWQDFMFANLDYPIADEDFRATVELEARAVLDQVAGRPSTVVVCGNSEIEQQVAMLGLDPALGRGELFGELLPALIAECGTDAVYVPSAPCGGPLPFSPDAGVANYFGVGGYRRPIEDARRAEVRFASECLAIANVPDDATLDALLVDGSADLFDDPRWKAGVPSDNDTDWDFDDVRDHYLRLLFDVDPDALRRDDRARYLDLSRQVSGEVMAEVFGEWRRAGSPCAGGIVLWLRDLVPGAGWGLVDATGRPKVAYHHLRRVLAPVAVWTTDEGLRGIDVHVANDRPDALRGRLRVALYRDGEIAIEEAAEDLGLAPHSSLTRNAEGIIGRFTDAAYAYRFGPPGHDTVVVTLEDGDGATLSQAVRFPVGRPHEQVDAEKLGITAISGAPTAAGIPVTVASRCLAYGVRVDVAGFEPSDDAFCVEPGHDRQILLRPRTAGATLGAGTITALNLRDRAPITAR